MNLVDDKQEIMENMITFDRYRCSKNAHEREFFRKILKGGRHFVYAVVNGRQLLCPSRFVGYQNNTKRKHESSKSKDGKETSRKLRNLLGHEGSDRGCALILKEQCSKMHVKPDNHKRSYWNIGKVTRNGRGVFVFKEHEKNRKIEKSADFIEGAKRRVWGDKYERNRKARLECIEYYGCRCFVCGFSFEEAYGPEGRGFIHVHHLIPINKHKKLHRVDPINDLRPVCPNCHSMIHLKDSPFTINEVKNLRAQKWPRVAGQRRKG